MRSCGLDPSEAGEVKAILDLYRRKSVVPPKSARLQGLIAEHDDDSAMAVGVNEIIGLNPQAEDLHRTLKLLDSDKGMARAERAGQNLEPGVDGAEVAH